MSWLWEYARHWWLTEIGCPEIECPAIGQYKSEEICEACIANFKWRVS